MYRAYVARQKRLAHRTAEQVGLVGILVVAAVIELLGRIDRTVLLGMHPEEAEEPRGRRRREWNGGTRIGMYYRR